MKLYYYGEYKNFGDILNIWLWPKLLPNIFDEDGSTLFMGIGTLLNDLVPAKPFKVVFGTGVGYGNGLPVIDKNWKIYCVRGPLSAQALGLDSNLAATDGAMMLRKMGMPAKQKHYPVSFMPHWQSTHWNWKPICKQAGLHYIDPAAEIEQVLQDIQCSDLVIAEAMHGAIVADALRVPWIPVQANKWILKFKWQDWCQSVGLEYKPICLPRLYSEANGIALIRKKLRNIGLYHNSIFTTLAQTIEFGVSQTLKMVNNSLSNQIVKTLSLAIKGTAPTLSSDQAISSVTSRLEEKLEQFKYDYISGCLLTTTSNRRVN